MSAGCPGAIEVATYYVLSEALTNAAKHANASQVTIDLQAAEGTLSLTIRDDGVGGADASGGSGLLGLKDRVEALGGTIEVASPPGRGTRLEVEIPLLGDAAVASEFGTAVADLGASGPATSCGGAPSGCLLELGQ